MTLGGGRIGPILALFLASLALAGCAVAATPVATEMSPPTERPAPTATATARAVDIQSLRAAPYPRVDGSTSAYPLQFMVACHILEVECGWGEGFLLDPTRRIVPNLGSGGEAELETLWSIFHSGTHGAYMNLIMGTTDLILVARQPSQDELLSADGWNVELDVQPIALDAFVFLVHSDNPVESLSLEQLRAIFSGRASSWEEVGGSEGEIHPYLRNPNSGSQELMEQLVMAGEPMVEAPDMVLETMMGPINAIRDDPLGIGYSVYFYAANMLPNENVRMVAVEGTLPDSTTIAEGSYPLVTEVYAVLRRNTLLTSRARTLRDWLLTQEGQQVVMETGYVPLRP